MRKSILLIKRHNQALRLIVQSVFMTLLFGSAVTAPVIAAERRENGGEEVVIAPLPDRSLDIPASQLPILQIEALKGSVPAARRLVAYYMWIEKKSDPVRYWQMIGAENGDLTARYEIALDLAEEPDEQSRIRARYWLQKIVDEGPAELAEHARIGLQQLDMYDKSYRDNAPH